MSRRENNLKIKDLELITSKEISRALRTTARIAGYAGAYVLALPIGTFLWMEGNTAENTGMELVTSTSLGYSRQRPRKPSWRSHVSGLYDVFKPYS